MNKSKIAWLVVLVVVVVSGTFYAAPAWAGAKVIAIKGVSYNVNASMTDNLNSLVGKKVKVVLAGGKMVAGVVKTVGNHLVHIEKLDGGNFFDALIRIDDIHAVSTQFRKYKR